MTIFVTGASGFIGGRIVQRLTADGHTVRAMARSERSAAKVAALGAEPVTCSLEDVAAEHLDGIDAVVHAAAYVEDYGPHEAYERANVGGTRRMLDAARGAGVARFVHISSVAAIWDGGDLVDADEQTPYPERFQLPYASTKSEAERLVLAEQSLHTVALRPCIVWGPGDTTFLPVVRRMAEDGSWVWLDGGQAVNSTTHVDNLAHAVVLALSEGGPGRAYFVTDDVDRSLRQHIGELAATEGLELPGRSVPGWLGRAAAHAIEGAWSLVGATSAPPLTRFAALAASRTITVRHDRAREELGYRPVVTVAEGVAQLAA